MIGLPAIAGIVVLEAVSLAFNVTERATKANSTIRTERILYITNYLNCKNACAQRLHKTKPDE